jgi:pentatricopeptide repeat protein
MRDAWDQALDQVLGLIMALALATIAIEIGIAFWLLYQGYLWYRRQRMVDEGRKTFKEMLVEGGITIDVPNALNAAMAGGLRFSQPGGNAKFPGL